MMVPTIIAQSNLAASAGWQVKIWREIADGYYACVFRVQGVPPTVQRNVIRSLFIHYNATDRHAAQTPSVDRAPSPLPRDGSVRFRIAYLHRRVILYR